MCKDHEVHTSVFVEDYLSPKSNPKQLEKDIAGKTNNQYCNQYVGEIIMTCLSSLKGTMYVHHSLPIHSALHTITAVCDSLR